MPAKPSTQQSTPARSTSGRRVRLSAEERRASIVGAATEVFAEHGYQRTKVSEVARRLGVSEPVVFQNFGSKAALYAAVVEHAADAMAAMLRELADSATPVPELLDRLLGPGHLDQLHARGSLGVIFADAMALTAEDAVAQAARAGVGRLAEAIAELLARGAREGDLRADLDPPAAAWWILSWLASHHFRATTMPDRGRLEDGIAELMVRSLSA